MRPAAYSFALVAALSAAVVHAQSVTYRCLDASGRSTYTNVKEEMTGKKCTVVSREVSVVPAQQFAPVPTKGEKSAAKGSGERVDATTQRNRDETRRKILQEELDSAEKRLTDARQKLTEQDAIRTPEEKVDPRRAMERLKPYQQEVERQEQNIASLKRELSNLR
jgi:hypothetical protein